MKRYASWGTSTPHIILCVDLYSWVGEEEGYDGCVAILSRPMKRGPAILKRQRSRRRGEGCKEIIQGRGRGEGPQEEEGGSSFDSETPSSRLIKRKLSGGDSDSKNTT